jgi:cell division protein FtsB
LKISTTEQRSAKSQESDDKLSLLWQQYGRGVMGLLILFLIVHDVFGAHGFLAMRHTQAEIGAVNRNLLKLNAENGRLAEYVHNLKTSPATIEQLARVGLPLAKPGEIIIKVPEPKWSDPDQTGKP